MFLENLVLDAHDPHLVGRFWAEALDGTVITDEPDQLEVRLTYPGDFYLDLAFGPPVDEPVDPQPRLHFDLYGGPEQAKIVERMLSLGARHLDVGQHNNGGVPWVVLADPEGNPFCVMEDRPAYVNTGPIAAIPIDSADPIRDAEFWAWLTGWVPYEGVGPATLRHPSGHGPLLEFCDELAPARTKNRLHLDVRQESDDPDIDTITRRIEARGGRLFEHDWGPQPWTIFDDPSGNVFCVLPRSE
ncbi:VOC family protein [Propionibacteriaceae bacterium Y1685]|uniref:VOC family protein n=1 Tax=Microlunatus sp. Y1700 TaxID=3418487 RepID=UPI003B81179E